LHEIEIKVRVESAEETARRLEELGAELSFARHFEANTLWDLPGMPLTGAGRLLRVRTARGRTVVTAKGPAAAGVGDEARFKIRREAELEVAEAAGIRAVLETAGFRPLWRYQKWRREYRLFAAAVVVDEIPHGTWVEIEGDAGAIDRVAAALGFGEADRVRESYREIHERACTEAGRPVGDMIFEGAAAPEGE